MILLAVFLASIMGSAHCAGMCGGFVALYSAERTRSPAPHIAYNFGRLVSYLGVGALAGTFGLSLDRAGRLVELQHTAAIFLAAVVLLWGIALWRRNSLVPVYGGGGAAVIGRAYRSLLKYASAMPPALLALSIGLLSALLPCGWLYLYVATAVGSASPSFGAAILFMFWLGTLPMMAAVGLASSRLTGKMRHLLPRASAAVLIFAALLSFEQHLDLFNRPGSAPDHCHQPAATR